jgi:predicted alpha-1,2-mannosidase
MSIRNLLLILTFSTFPLFGQYTQYVNPFIGTGGHGHTYPGATVPFGMVQLSPDTRVDGSWDGCGGYHYSDTFIYGFSHTHLSGTGVSDYGDILLMPVTGKPTFEPKEYGSTFRHDNETAKPGYYKVQLDNGNILAELSSTLHCGIHRYSFNKLGFNSVVLDLQHRDRLTGYEIKQVGKNRIEGYRKSEAWAKEQYVYFTIEFSQPILKTTWHENKTKVGFTFLTKGAPIEVKVSLSFCNNEGSNANLNAELNQVNFDSTVELATQLWENELGKIQAQSSDPSELVKFYTALYHCFLQPNTASDVNGNYRGMDMKIHKAEGYTHYTVFSLWDTYRALHPLLTVIDRKRTRDFIRTFLAMYKDGGRLPFWELAANETDCMIGYHAASVISDAFAKGIQDFDTELALEAMIAFSNENKYGKRIYQRDGFISSEYEAESVSKTLEYAYDDWCISLFASSLGKDSIAAVFKNRSNSWYQLFDPKTGFMRPRFNGNWMDGFDPREVNNHFTEGNSWQYSFYVPHDPRDFMAVHGGMNGAIQKLDALFAEKSGTTGREQADITGLIGQYAHGNEPSHHIAYMYNYFYAPERTQHLVHSICTEFYTTAPDGLIGNEDCGQMSAWYVLSALGFYQLAPGLPQYTLGTPALDKATIQLENGKQFKIETKNRSIGSWYAVPKYDNEVRMFISDEEMQQGGTLQFYVSSQLEDESHDYLMIPADAEMIIAPAAPIIHAPRSFKGETKITIEALRENERIFYFLNSDSLHAKLYQGPIQINRSSSIRAFAVKDVNIETLKSPVTVAHSYKVKNTWELKVNATPNKQYTAGGASALIDGIRGTTNWRAGDWQGYQSQDFEATLDVGSMQLLTEVRVGFLQDANAWMFLPQQMEVLVSSDGTNFTSVGFVKTSTASDSKEVQVIDYSLLLKNQRKTRYIKVKAKNFGKLPSWHPGHIDGGDAFIFIDEIEIK